MGPPPGTTRLAVARHRCMIRFTQFYLSDWLPGNYGLSRYYRTICKVLELETSKTEEEALHVLDTACQERMRELDLPAAIPLRQQVGYPKRSILVGDRLLTIAFLSRATPKVFLRDRSPDYSHRSLNALAPLYAAPNVLERRVQ